MRALALSMGVRFDSVGLKSCPYALCCSLPVRWHLLGAAFQLSFRPHAGDADIARDCFVLFGILPGLL